MSVRHTAPGTLRSHLSRLRTTTGLRLRAWAAEPDRGDVPGWVLITIMTAGLVAALWLVAEPLLTDLFTTAVTSVGG